VAPVLPVTVFWTLLILAIVYAGCWAGFEDVRRLCAREALLDELWDGD
jgi:hypothetical protein